MSTTKPGNDIGGLIQQFRQRETTTKERKVLLVRIEEILQDVTDVENLPVKWMYILDNICWPILTKNDRNDMKSMAVKVIRHIGALLFFTESLFSEFLTWLEALYLICPKKIEETRSDLVYSVYFIVGFCSKSSKKSSDAQNVLKSLKWIIDIIPNASMAVYNQCLKGIVLVSNTHPDVSEQLFETSLRTICSNLPDFNTHDKNFELLVDTITKFSENFAARPEFAEEIVRIVRPTELKNVRELKRRMKLVMAVVKMAKSRKMLDETNAMILEFTKKGEENGGKWSSAILITIICDVFNELLILGKNDEEARAKIEESLSFMLKDLNLSKQNTKEKQAFFNSLAKIFQIVTQLPVESPIKTRVHEIVFNEKTGIFTAENRDNRIFGHNTIFKDLNNLISVLLTPTSLNHLQACYTDLRKIMIESMRCLKNSEKEPKSDLIRWHESTLLLFFSSLQGISCAKSSLIVMMGIRPSIFEFFTQELPLTEYWLASNHPQVYHMFITILCKHLEAHDYYISQSDYVTRGDNSSIGQTKREYAHKQIVALQKIIASFGKDLWERTRLLISKWLKNLVETAIHHKISAESFESKEWIRLRSTVFHNSMLQWNNDSISQTLTILGRAAKWPDISMEIEKDITDRTKKAKWKEAAAIWEAGDCNVYIRQSVSPMYKMQQERQQKYISSTSFGAEEFTLVTDFLLRQVVPTTFRKGPNNWMDEILDTITQGCRNISQEKLDATVPEGFIEKWDWTLNQTANYCIVNKMKTPLGKPMETFYAFSSEINRLAKEVMARKPSKKSTPATEENGNLSPTRNSPHSLKYSIQWLRVHLLLKLIEILEKLMSSAIYGGSSVFTLVEIPVTSRQFFTTNSTNCEVWLNRLYYPALIVAHFNGNYGLVIRFGSAALTHYARQTDEKSAQYGVNTACLMCLSMAIMGEPMEIVGLRRRVREEFKTEMGQRVMEALGEMASSRYEIALNSLEVILVTDMTVNETLKIVIQIAIMDMLNRIRLPQVVDYYRKTIFGEETDAVTEDFKSIEMLTKYEKLGNEKRHVVDWSARERMGLVESAFTQTMRRQELLDHQKDVAALGALVLSTDTSCKLYSEVSSTSLVIANLVDRMTGVSHVKNQISENLEIFDKNDNGNDGDKLAICRKLMHWSRNMKIQRGQSSQAHSEIIRLSRKTSNFELAQFHINSAIRSEQLGAWQRLEIDRQRLKLVKNQQLDVKIREMNEVFGSLAGVFDSSFQMKTNFAIMQDLAIKEQMIADGFHEEMNKREEHMSRASIQIADFFNNLPEMDSVLAPNLFPTMLWSDIQERSDELACGYPAIIGALYDLSTQMCPKLAKSHLKMARWSFEMAKIENSPAANMFGMYTFGETSQENEELWKCLETTSIGQLEKMVKKVLNNDPSKFGNLMVPNGQYLHCWELARSHRTKFLTIAVAEYFKFIENMSGGGTFLPYSKKEETILATLRILELLVKHGDVLVDVINDGLEKTNVHVWKEILPQLFARLSHPSEHIRQTLTDLISRICTAAPHAVVFQVVSGACSSDADLDELEEQLEKNDDRNRVRACCEQLESKMAQSYPSLVRDVRQFVAELERINLLNEEKWSVVLGSMEHEMEKRLALVRTENAKTMMNIHLSQAEKEKIMAEKSRLMTRQIFDTLDELYQQTMNDPPKTKNEAEFMTQQFEILSAAFKESKEQRVFSAERGWAPIKNLVANFVHRHQKKGMQSFETSDVSPYLASLEHSCVPMPGQESVEFDRVVSIAKVSRQVTILPTKTRPKKLGFVGSDGKSVAFLFKGREDLHLDERVMQFLRLCNTMLHPGKEKRAQVPEYQAHHYAVIPLGPRSGLIRWVEGATAMFYIYKKWQLKERALKQATKKNGETVADVERPSEQYHKMIRQAFHNHKVDASIASDRTKWPAHILQEVFEGLSSKTPEDLISRELWMRANEANTWWAVTKRYARSLAVMSMIGSVLGLGDRHLDNLLVDLKFGFVVHIDYNICFDKGKNLRIPETVPFRLTRNMRHALGPSEVYGTFRESCVHVLSTLRNGRQVLTMLLDAFVFDPLVDWTNHEHMGASGVSLAVQLAVYGNNWKGKTRDIEMRMAETRKLLMLRVREMDKMWLENREELRRSMKEVTECLIIEKTLLGANGIYAQRRVQAGTELREAITRHQALAKEIRPLLRFLGKEKEEVAEYLKFYKQGFMEPLLKGHSALRHEADIDLCVLNFNVVMSNIDYVFQTLVNLAQWPMEFTPINRNRQAPPPGLENVWVVRQDQQENSQAREVVRRVERRLNGWVDASERKLSPREEADLLIAEATDITNLSQMYEGWTAWV